MTVAWTCRATAAAAAVALIVAGIDFVGCRTPFAPEGLRLEGVVRDEYTLEPVAFRKVRLQGLPGPGTVGLETTTGADGSFVFMGVPKRGRYTAQLDGGRGLCKAGNPLAFSWDPRLAIRGVLEGGMLVTDSGDTVRWAAACRDGSEVPPLAHADLLVFELEAGEWRHAPQLRSLTPRWKAILCLENTAKTVGRYGLIGSAEQLTVK